ncbi:MAG: HD domain-containing protein [Planctomycetota bacterium]|jgi:guanosine-3',5'-bis(diphosphate) 3'-pyrophosphohydrolase
MTQENPWHEASAMAARAHRNQTRKDDKKTPYFSHPVRVALTLAVKFGCTDDDILAAALLHDVLEDTRADYDDLLEKFGPEIANIVVALSKDTRKVEPEREDEYYEKLADASCQVKLIKLADVYDNLSDAPCPKILKKALNSATRTLDIATEPELQEAVRIVTDLKREVEGRLTTT